MTNEKTTRPLIGGKTASFLFDIVETLAFTVMGVLLCILFVFRPSVVDGKSMQNTLQDKENLLVWSLFYTPRQGDVIIFDALTVRDWFPPEEDVPSALVKRVIATEGQHVRVSGNEVWVDGEKLEEPYVFRESSLSLEEEWDVPRGYVFVMGDHRDGSSDSRVFGPVPEETVLGRVFFRFSPFTFFPRRSGKGV